MLQKQKINFVLVKVLLSYQSHVTYKVMFINFVL